VRDDQDKELTEKMRSWCESSTGKRMQKKNRATDYEERVDCYGGWATAMRNPKSL
jgi:hypothetical protein